MAVASTSDYAALSGATFTGTVTAPKIALTDTTDVSLSSTGNPIQIGATSGVNLVVDNNEIQVRNNGAGSGLFLNIEGGEVGILTTSGANGNLTFGNTTGTNNLIVNGYLHVYFTLEGIVDKSSFNATLESLEGELLWRGKLFATTSENIQEYSMNTKTTTNKIIL
jgi:hypothetical protein